MIYETVNERKFIVPEQPVSNPYLINVKVGSSVIDSETQNIIPIVVPLEGIRSSEKQIIFCDTPGFQDTRGSEIDISNGIAIRKCVEVCKGIKPVIIISSQLGDKLQFLSELAEVLNSMFLDFENDVANFIFIYTKFSSDINEAQNQIIGLLESADKSLEQRIQNREEVSRSFQIMLKEMLDRAYENVIVINPIEMSRADILTRIMRTARFINKLDERVSDSLSNKSQKKLELQIAKHFDALEKSMQIFDYEYAIYRFKQLRELKGILKKKEINKLFEAIVIKLIENFNIQFSSKLEELKNKLNNKMILTEDEILNLLNFLKSLKNSDGLFQQIEITDESKDIKDKFNEMNQNICDIFSNVANELFEKGLYEQSHNISILLNNLNNFVLKYEELEINKDSSKIKDVYDQFKTKIIQEMEVIALEIEVLIKFNGKEKEISDEFAVLEQMDLKNDFNYSYFTDLSKQLNMMKRINDELEGHFEEKMLRYDHLRSLLHDVFVSKSTMFDQVLNEADKEKLVEKLDDKLLNEINRTSTYFKIALTCHHLHEHIKIELVEDFQSTFTTKITECFENIVEKSNEILSIIEENRLLNTDILQPRDINIRKIK